VVEQRAAVRDARDLPHRTAAADAVLLDAVVVTGDPDRPRADAIAVRDGRIVALGAAARELARHAGRVERCAGAAVLPAFGDGHVHPLWGGVELADAPVREARSVAEVVTAVAEHARAHPEREWVLGGSYDPALAPGGRFDAAWLDAVVPDRPVVLTSADHHAVWCNTEALRRGGVDAATRDPSDGEVCRRPDGTPLGTLVEWSAMDLVTRHVPARTAGEKEEGLLAAARLLAAAGVTWVQEAAVAPGDVETYRRAADSAGLPLRADLALRAEPGEWREQRTAFAAARASVDGHPDVSARTVKLFADGVVEHGTAAMTQPYTDAPDSCGHPVWDPRELAEAVSAFDADGFRVHVHAIGDAGVRAALDAIERAIENNGPRERRHVLAHVHVVDPRDVARFARLGVIACLQPLWAQLDDVMEELTLPRLGPERARWQYPFGDLQRAGARLSTGSDWPVSSLRPLEYLAVAATRTTPEGRPDGGWLPEQRLPVEVALAAASAGVAYQAREEHAWGILREGMRADLVVLAEDPTAIPPDELAGLPVLATWSGGREVHRG
jgi:predicted amidohydrolase YtcJ